MSLRKVIALLLVLVLLACGVRYMLKVERSEQEKVSSLYATVEPLQKEREELVTELDSLELDYALMMRDVSTVQLLFREVDQILFQEVYPLMRDRGFTGVIGLSSSQIPGHAKKISVEQYNRLIMDGWGSCYVYDSYDELTFWLTKVKWRIENQGLTAPSAIYFVGDSYRSEYDEILKSYGITTVIVDAEDGRSGTVTDVMGEIWFTGAMPWNYTGVNGDTDLLARTDGGNLTFTISFNSLWDAYEKDNFQNTLKLWEGYAVTEETTQKQHQPGKNGAANDAVNDLETPLLRVLNYDESRKAHQEASQNNAVLEKEFQQRQTDLKNRIAELDEQIRRIYDEWRQ